jgi:ComF family protein
VWISTNFEDPAQKLVHLYKFGQLRAAAEPIAELMSGTFAKSNPAPAASDYIIVPVPTATSRVRQRGFDHSALLAKLLARKLGFSCRPALGRLGQSRQLGSLRSQRLVQATDNYYVRLPRIVNGRNVLLVDDVATTGATLIGAARALRQSGARRVDALVFAKRL